MAERQTNHELYQRKIALRHAVIVASCAALLILSLIVSMNIGYIPLSPMDTLRTLMGDGTERETLILFQFRLPRILISVLVGAGLALSGCIVQGISRNALADPGLLGIHAGAGLMVILYVLFFGAQSFLSVLTLPFLALTGAGITAVMIYVLAFKPSDGVALLRLILTGLAVQAGISALTTVLVVKLDDTQFDFVALWQAGSIWGSNWKFILALLPWMLLLIPYVLMQSRVLDVLSFGDETAVSLGLGVEKERRRLLAAAVALAAVCVAVSGSIGFIGLIAPHLARRLVGPKHVILLPACGLIGAALLSAADTLARGIMQPAEIPAGIMAAMIGAPYFLYLLARTR
ncbi:FecCD family ABC transporter permease [Acetonema longum]|uniref:Ferrichrome ABC transporter, permease protein FhuG n=1 Tax=Acetonema longum DSM 6540 TaxID=1009370 RepID=F7NM56_9FIRM|nr:iron ABC transporter permease [Acetonema longum]EGO62857.1 ferrichrome ABC transporter, permease protein FhuG [Acetonema longum DSM 6540]